jgi:hypothetical protein
MTQHTPDNTNDIPEVVPAASPTPRQRRQAILAAVLIAVPVLLVLLFKTFFVYVPPGKGLVIISKAGADLPPQQVLAKEGQKGVQEKMLGEGYHFVWPIIYTTELKDLTIVPPTKVGVVTNLAGDRPVEDTILVNSEHEQGIRRYVLLPGAYRLNPYGYKVELCDRVEIQPGFVGVQRRLLGKDGGGRFAENKDEKGILKDVLQPGIYYVNLKEYQLIPCAVGVDQTSYGSKGGTKDRKPAITFNAKDGYPISVDCTIEYEVRPDDWPALVAEFGSLENIERNVIDVRVEQICRDRGFNFGAEEFLEGTKREAFQQDFERELDKVCGEKQVHVRSAFIRNIVIPDEFLVLKRKLELSRETQLTNKERELTSKSEAAVERQQKEIESKVAQIKAETSAMAAQIQKERTNLQDLTKEEIDKLKSEYNVKIAALEGDKTRALGEADAKVKEMKETAKNAIYKMRMDVFEGNGDAYLRYAAAQQLSPDLRIRLFQSGPGTLWTNMDAKGLNLMVSPQGGQKPTTDK